ncbi:MAG: D-3-phosphoglycerate dehydrogenase [Pirellulaceae bacterium]|nr:MAG: D-3-phosphoglycerate dehydrogenase [Pirellulaceae bacterium]
MARIIVLDDLSPEGLALLDAAPDIQYDVRTGLSGSALRQALLEYDGAICRSGVKITADVLEGNRRLKVIVRAGVGTDNIDKTAATRLGIIVMNTPAGNTISTAEHTFALMLAMSRNIAPAYQSLCQGKWDRKSFMGVQLAGKTLGVIGLGRIGQEVAKRAVAFGMRVIGYDPFLTTEQAARLGVERVERVRDLLPHVDYLTVHTPLTDETYHMIGHAEIELLKPGARLINCARGGIYDEQALVEGLRCGKLAGVALDVFEHEPCTSSPLFGMPGVVCTPHLGASTEEAQAQVAIEAAQLLVNYFTTGEVRHAVNMASIDPKTLAGLRSFLDLAYRLGLLLAQWQEGGARAVRLSYRGDVTRQDTRLLTAAFCAGLLARALDEDVNIVNAEILLRERGIELHEETNREMGSFRSSIMATVTTDQQSFVAAGTLFGAGMPRLVRVGDYRLEGYLDGNLMLFLHDDVPGIIGAVGTIFGRYRVNIAQMSVGRKPGAPPGGESIGVMNLDDVPPAEAIEEILRHPHLKRVKIIRLPAAGQLPSWLELPSQAG